MQELQGTKEYEIWTATIVFLWEGDILSLGLLVTGPRGLALFALLPDPLPLLITYHIFKTIVKSTVCAFLGGWGWYWTGWQTVLDGVNFWRFFCVIFNCLPFIKWFSFAKSFWRFRVFWLHQLNSWAWSKFCPISLLYSFPECACYENNTVSKEICDPYEGQCICDPDAGDLLKTDINCVSSKS